MPCYENASQAPPGYAISGTARAYTTEADCLEACAEGACCEVDGSCNIKPRCECDTENGAVFAGVGETCEACRAWCCYTRPAGNQFLCLEQGWAASVEILAVEVDPDVDPDVDLARGDLSVNYDPLDGGMPQNPLLEVSTNYGSCGIHSFSYQSAVARRDKTFGEEMTNLVGILSVTVQPDGTLSTRFRWQGYVGFWENNLGNYFAGRFSCGAPEMPRPNLEITIDGFDSVTESFPLWSGNYGGIGGFYCLPYGRLVTRITIEEYESDPPPDPPESIYNCYQDPPPGEGWTSTGSCHPDKTYCAANCGPPLAAGELAETNDENPLP